MHISEIAFKLYAFVYNYPGVKPQMGGLIVALLRTPLLADPVDKYVKISRKKHHFNMLHKFIMDYDVSVKLTRKPLKRSKSPTPQFIKFDLLATPLKL